ncbi:hypothetical protein BDW69DRAFT_178672 [Aspergillus filifer]
MEHLAASYPRTSFIRSFPGAVRTGLDRDLGGTAGSAVSGLILLPQPWELAFEESVPSDESVVRIADVLLLKARMGRLGVDSIGSVSPDRRTNPV